MRVTLQERRVDAILEVGRPEVAVSELQPLISEHPFRERLWWQRMLALHRCGRTEEALNAFHRARRSLITEIGLEPGPELVDLQQRILRRDPTLDLPVVRPPRAPPRGVEVHLPRPRALIGRRRDQAELVAALSTSALVTIAGPAGCGKTLLAIETARAAAPEFVDGVWFVDLSTADVDADVAATVATVLDLPVPPASSPLQILAAYGQDRRVLLVLDNCEQVLDQAAELCEVLTQPELQVAVLTTSREPLGLEAEQVHALGPLPVQDPTGAPAQLPAVALFVARSRLRAHDLGPLELASVLQICRAVDGIPLAVELAAALTSTYTLTEIAEQVERDPGQLSAIGRGQARHHQTLIAAIERSHRLLSPEEQVVHRRLSVLPGTFSRPLAEAVVGSDVDRPVSGVLARLVHRSLLTAAHPGGADTEFTQLAPVRAHARHALERSGELDLTEQLRDRWTVAVARRRPPAGSTAEGAWHAQIFGNLGTIRATLHRRLITEPGPLGAEVAVQLTGFWFYQDLLEEGGRWIELALRKAADTGPATLPTQLSLASVLLIQGRIDQGRDLFHEALAGVRAAVPDQPVHRVPAPDRPPALDDPMLVAELLLAAAAAFSVARDAESMRTALAVVGTSGALEDDPHLAAGHEAISCLAESMSAPLEHTLARAEASFARATAVGNLWAGWLSCSSATSVALARQDPALGLPWSRRLMHLQAQLGARAVLQQVETFGDFLALDGRFLPAVTRLLRHEPPGAADRQAVAAEPAHPRAAGPMPSGADRRRVRASLGRGSGPQPH